MTLPIETQRLVLRRFLPGDFDDLIALAVQPSIVKEVPEFNREDPGSVEAYIAHQNSLQPFEEGQLFDLAIELKGEQRVIGLLSMQCGGDQQGQFGLALGAAYRNLGLATEAARGLFDYCFRSIGLHKIGASTDSHNIRSWQMMERLGMKREGCLREVFFLDGEWLDEFVYGILITEWAQDVGYELPGKSGEGDYVQNRPVSGQPPG